jgi:hypothetical protein
MQFGIKLKRNIKKTIQIGKNFKISKAKDWIGKISNMQGTF